MFILKKHHSHFHSVTRIVVLCCLLLSVGNNVFSEIPLPTPIPNNPEYLVRLIYLIPTDRLLDYTHYPNCPEYFAKVDDATARIRTALETINDFTDWQINDIFTIPYPPGCRMNFERENNGTGPIRILIVHGTRVTEGSAGYWGDAAGLNGAVLYGRAVEDVLSYSKLPEKTRTTCYLLVPDVAVWDNSLPGFRGYIGLGQSVYSNSNGWGGVAMITAGILAFFPPDTGDPVTRKLALENSLSSTTQQIVVPNPYSGTPETWSFVGLPSDTLGKGTSTYHGVLAHEMQHMFGVGHGGLNQLPANSDLMGGGYYLFGHTVSEMYGFNDQAYPYDPPGTVVHLNIPALGEIYSHYLAHSPYYSSSTNTDKTDPFCAFGYPPYGYVWPESPPDLLSMRAIEEPAGSGLDAAYLFTGIDLWDGLVFSDTGRTEPCRIVFSRAPCYSSYFSTAMQPGPNFFNAMVTDLAGNTYHDSLGTFKMKKDSYVNNNTVFVRPHDAPRDLFAELGSYNNAYDSIQNAIDTLHAAGSGTVFVMNGTYPISTSILPKPNINLVGESVGNVILDGQDNSALNIMMVNDATNANFSNTQFQMTCISNLTFANARAGIYKTGTFNTYNFAITNCLFYNLSYNALHLANLDLNVRIMQNSVIDCQSGIYLANYPNRADAQSIVDNPDYRFELRNNMVVNRSGTGTTGIEISNIQGLRIKGRSGWNNSHGYLTNFNGTDNYTTLRFPGETSQPVSFMLTHPFDFGLQPGSRGAGEGDPLTGNTDGSRRDIGAFINTSGSTAASCWMIYY